ncbi:MAG: hypothetical protein KF864_05705 [Phycisphaeraceae bacterium]|nr:hypothetical protein [Phycisphaeraceae bacterium]
MLTLACGLLTVGPHALGAPPLAGPRVNNAAPTRASIVTHSFNGEVQPAEPTPEEAAARLLDLSPQERAAVDAVFARRAAGIDRVIEQNYTLLLLLGTAGQSGDPRQTIPLLVELARVLRPVLGAGQLEDQVAAVLPEASRARFREILADYWRAYGRDRRRHPKPDGTRPGRYEIMLSARLESLGREGERAFQRLLMSGDLIFLILFKDITLDADQSEYMRGLVSAHMEKTRGNATNEENARLFFSIVPWMNQQQREQLMRNINALSPTPPPSPPPPPPPPPPKPSLSPPTPEAHQPGERPADDER